MLKRLTVAGLGLATAWVLAAGPAAADGPVSYHNEEQLERAQAIYAQHCSSCHGSQPEQGSAAAPPLAGLPFMFFWEGKSVLELVEYTQETMPQTRPGSLTADQYLDLVALILAANEMPGGDAELSNDPEVLGGLLIVQDSENGE